MKKNIGIPGRMVRLGVALVLLFFAYWKGSWLLLAGSLFVFFEVYMSWCIVFHFLGINHCPMKKK